MIKFFKQMHPNNKFYFVTSILLNWLISIIVMVICFYISSYWLSLFIGFIFSIFLMIKFTKFYIKKYFRHEEGR